MSKIQLVWFWLEAFTRVVMSSGMDDWLYEQTELPAMSKARHVVIIMIIIIC